MQFSKRVLFFLLLFTITIAVSCKKKGLNYSTIKIATVDYRRNSGVAYHYRITYNSFNSVDSIVKIGGGTDTGTNTFSVFSYTGSSFRISDQQGLSYLVLANTKGQILQIHKVDTILLTYEGNELTGIDYKAPSSVYPYYVISSFVYHWRNGDFVTISTPLGAVDSIYYDNSRGGQIGDAMRIDNFLAYGRSFTSTNHLPSQLKYANGKQDYYYTFDGDGRISKLTKVISDNSAPSDTSEYIFRYY